MGEDKTQNKRGCAKSSLVYNNYFTLYKYHNIKKIAKHSFDSNEMI